MYLGAFPRTYIPYTHTKNFRLGLQVLSQLSSLQNVIAEYTHSRTERQNFSDGRRTLPGRGSWGSGNRFPSPSLQRMSKEKGAGREGLLAKTDRAEEVRPNIRRIMCTDGVEKRKARWHTSDHALLKQTRTNRLFRQKMREIWSRRRRSLLVTAHRGGQKEEGLQSSNNFLILLPSPLSFISFFSLRV